MVSIYCRCTEAGCCTIGVNISGRDVSAGTSGSVGLGENSVIAADVGVIALGIGAHPLLDSSATITHANTSIHATQTTQRFFSPGPN